MGKIDEKLVALAETKLSKVFKELAINYDNRQFGTGWGGDPLIFSLLFPIEHVCTLSLPTAGTDGKRVFWNPKWLVKKSLEGIRLVCGHESFHALLMHPERIGGRNKKIWNIAADYVVNYSLMQDLEIRGFNSLEIFNTHLGTAMSLDNYINLIKNPFKSMSPNSNNDSDSDKQPPSVYEDRTLTEDEIKEIELSEKKILFYYADLNLKPELRTPEAIYSLIYGLLPKCEKCGSIGKYKNPSSKPGNSSNQNDTQNNKPGDSKNPDKSCDCCGGGIDIFGLGGTVDSHMDATESKDELHKRVNDAVENARRMNAGSIPSSLEDELGLLTAPKISWKDLIRLKLFKARDGNTHNDWSRFKSRPMFAGLYVPKKKSIAIKFGCLLDTSASMSRENMSLGVSQLASLDSRSEGVVVPADANIYWDKATQISQLTPEALSKIKIVGRGGTKYAEFFSDYEKNIGKCNFLVIITDGILDEMDILNMKNPGIDTVWLITSQASFKPPFGKAFNIEDV